jgi:hypothetical protein
LLRIGANDVSWHGDGDPRIHPEGRSLPGHSEPNKHIEGVPIPSKFFGE